MRAPIFHFASDLLFERAQRGDTELSSGTLLRRAGDYAVSMSASSHDPFHAFFVRPPRITCVERNYESLQPFVMTVRTILNEKKEIGTKRQKSMLVPYTIFRRNDGNGKRGSKCRSQIMFSSELIR